MPATLRGLSHDEFRGPGAVPAPEELRAGDTLLFFHTADTGGFAAMGTPAGGGTWQPLAAQGGNGFAGTKIWRKTVGDDPDEYGIGQHASADGVFAVLLIRGGIASDIQVVYQTFGGGVRTPAATPATASGLEIRYVAGAPFGAGTFTWGFPAGYPATLAQQSGIHTTAALSVRTLVSSEPLAAQPFTVSPELDGYHGFTILVPSADGVGGPPPAPPSFPAFTPGKGVAHTRYTVHDFLTGEYRGEIRPRGESYDRRETEAGTWNGFLPISNRREADRIAEIIPRDPADLTSGPGRLLIHSWRAGVLSSMNWLHTAIPAKSSRLGLGLQLQGTTLDGYMQSVALTSDQEWDGDQLDVFRAAVLHMGADPRSNPGFALPGGVSGVARPLLAKEGDFYGKILRDYARASDGFTYVANPTLVDGSIQRRIDIGSPFIQLDEEYVFSEGRDGGEITEWQEIISALAGGTRFGIIGGTPPPADATQASFPARSSLIETPHLAVGWPIIDQRIQHPLASTSLTELERYGAHYAATAAGAPRVFSASVILGGRHPFHPNSIGAMVRFKLANDWHLPGAERQARLIGWSLTPAQRGSGKDKLQVIVAGEGAA